MNGPRLTIGIPTHDRPEMLPRAIRSALAQTVPVRVLVADDGGDRHEISRIVDSFPGMINDQHDRLLSRRPTPTGSGPTGTTCARLCDTEFFLWLQDDDVILPTLAQRVIAAFDAFPEADTYMAPLKIALDAEHHWWNNGNGPWVPLSTAGVPDQWEGEILAPTCYFLAWSL
jgi:hypothetical protein